MDDATGGLAALDERLSHMTDTAKRFGSALSGALRAAIVDGKDLDDVLRRMMLQLSSSALDQALKPLASLLGSLAGSLAGQIGGMVGGLAAGPAPGPPAARAMPAGAATPDAAQSGRDGGGRVTVVFNVTTPDAESFRRSEAQLGGMLARAVGRGRRGL